MSPGVEEQAQIIVHSVARYTRFVGATKVGLGIIALFLIGLVLFYPLFRKDNGGVRIPLTTTTVKTSAPTTMSNAHFQGLDKDNQPYSMTADSAADGGTDNLALVNPAGEILLKSGQHLYIKSLTGVYQKKERLLTLKGKVDMANNQGYQMHTHSLFVDIGAKTAATSDEVNGDGPAGTIKAYGGAMADGVNQLIVFEGPVFVTLNMKSKPGEAATAQPATPNPQLPNPQLPNP